jgi:FkbM family methyltransferase
VRKIGLGHAFSAHFKDGYRKTPNFICSDVIAADIDRDWTIEEMLEADFIRENAAFLYTTASHTPERHRVRVVFLVERTITAATEWAEALAGLGQKLNADPSIKDADDTAYYLRRGFRVVAIEADTRLAKSAAERFGTQINSGQLRILNIGIAAEEGELPFWICETHSEWSSFDRKLASRHGCPHHEVMVRCRRFGSILEEFGIPYYLKIDIEGNDSLCVQDLDPRRLPKFISMETTSPDLLAERGFKRFKAISQINFLPIELPPVPEQRHYERIEWMLRTRNPLIRAFVVHSTDLAGLGIPAGQAGACHNAHPPQCVMTETTLSKKIRAGHLRMSANGKDPAPFATPGEIHQGVGDASMA